ncbi:extracellular solute-binding protein [Streptomyces sp. NPDC001922]|uniref:extracellular solute-binding protein n=1 Tax=Streptomyces sp. NPDC001922 TaxID=3364624 RepID=UPI00368EE5D5
MLLTLCAGCDGGDRAAPDPKPSPGEERVLRVATASDVSQGPVRQRLIEAWDRSQPDVRVEIVRLPAAADDARSQLVAALQSGGADYDVVNLDVPWTAEFAAGDLIRPLDGDPLHGMWGQVADTARFRKRIWAVPFNTDAALLYYRKDIWKDAAWRPPATWGELDTAAGNAKDPRQVRQTFPYGYATQLDSYEGLTVNAQEAVWAADGELVDTTGKVVAASVDTQEGLTDLFQRFHGLMPPETSTADERDSLEMFRDEKVPFMRNWPYVYNVLAAKGSKVAGKFGVVPLPGRGANGSSVLGGQNLAVTRDSAHPDDARRLLDFLVRPAQQRCLLEAGFAPVLKATYEAAGPRCSLSGGGGASGGEATSGEEASGEEGTASDEGGAGSGGDRTGGADGERASAAPEAGGEEAGSRKLPPWTEALRKALGRARPRPVTPYYAAFTELVQTLVHGRLENGGDEEDLAEDLDKDLRTVMEGG